MKVLVTGGAGFIGSHIVDLLLERKHEVMVLDDLSSGRRENLSARAEFRQEDIQWVGEIADEWGAEAICHQAAQPSLLKSWEEPILDAEINVMGTLRVATVAREYGLHVVMASTSAVYDAANLVPIEEHARLWPDRPYGIAKMAAEFYLKAIAPSCTILRYGNVYGPRQVPVGENQLIPHALEHILHGKPFKVNGDGLQTRDFVYVGDVAWANALALEGRQGGVYNIATCRETSVNDVLGIVKRVTEWDGEWEYGPYKPREPRRVCLANWRAGEVLGWQPQVPIREGIVKTVRAYEQGIHRA